MDVEVYVSRSGEYADVEVRLSAAGAQTPPIPAAFLLLIDSSKSMGEHGKLAQAVEIAKRLIASMGPSDVVAVYTFDERVKAVLLPTPAPEALERAKRLDKVKPGSYTFLYQALSKAIDDLAAGSGSLFRRGPSLSGYVKRIVLITDGEPWPHYTEERWYESLGRTAASYGISITAIGVGYDYNEKILYKLASASGGTWYHAANISDVSQILMQELGRSRALEARRPVVRIETDAEVVEARKLGRTIASLGPAREVALEDISAGEVASVVFRLRPKERLAAEVVVSTEEGEVRKQVEETAVLVQDKTAMLAFQLAGELINAAEGGRVELEVLQTAAQEEGLPEVYREKATRVIEALRSGSSKELIHEATTITYSKQQAQAGGTAALPQTAGETATARGEAQLSPGGAECEIFCVDTGKSMRVAPPAVLGRMELAEILPKGQLEYISRRHMELYIKDGDVYIRDAGSRNGIYIGGSRVYEARVSPDVDVVLAKVAKVRIKCADKT